MLSIYEQDEKFTQGEGYRRMRNMYASPSQVLTDMVLKLVSGKYAPNVPTAKLPKYAKTNNRPKSYYDLSELLVSPLYRKVMCRYLQRMDQDVSTSYGYAFLANWEQRSTRPVAESVGSTVSTVTPFEPNQQLRVSLPVTGNNGGAPQLTVSDPYVPRPTTATFLMAAFATGAIAPGGVPSVPSVPPPQFSRPEGVSQGTTTGTQTGMSRTTTMGTQTGMSRTGTKGTQARPKGVSQGTQAGSRTGTKSTQARPKGVSQGTQAGSRAVVSQETQTPARTVTNDLQERNSRNDEVRELTEQVSKLEQKLGEADAAAATQCAMLTSEILEMDGKLELANKYKEETMENLIQLEKELRVKVAQIKELVDAKDAGITVNIILRKELTQAETDLNKAEETLSYLKETTIQNDNEIRELNLLVDDLNEELYPDTADVSTMAYIPYQQEREPSITASLGGTADASTMTNITDEEKSVRGPKGIHKKRRETRKTAANPNKPDDPMDTSGSWLEYLSGAFEELKAQFNEMAVGSGNPPYNGSSNHVPLNIQLNAGARANVIAAEAATAEAATATHQNTTNQNSQIFNQDPAATPTPAATDMQVDEDYTTHMGTRGYDQRNRIPWNQQPRQP